MERRKFILATASLGAAGVAGCTGDGDDGNGSGGNGGEMDETETEGEMGDTQTETDSGGMDETETDSGGMDETETDSGGMDETETDSGGEGGNGPQLGSLAEWGTSFVAEYEFSSEEGGEFSGTLRFRDGNYKQVFESEQGTFEIYKIGEDVYQVVDGRCIKNPNSSFGTDFEFDNEEAVTGEDADRRPDRTETIDGERVYVYTTESFQGELFISAETGRPRRVVTEQGTVRYHSWGDVAPIEAPDLECREPGSGGDGDGGDDGGGYDPY